MTTIPAAGEQPHLVLGAVADPTAGFRRVAQAAALVTAPLCFAVANGLYSWATRHGGDDLSGANALALHAAHPRLMHWAATAAVLGCLLMVPAVLAAMTVLRRGAARLSLLGGSLIIGGYVCYFGAVTQSFVTEAMAERGNHLRDYAAVIDASTNSTMIAVFLLFVVGNLVGTLLLAIAMFRSHAVPVWAAAAVLAWPVLHVTGLVVGSEWFETTGALLQAIGFAGVAAVFLRLREAR